MPLIESKLHPPAVRAKTVSRARLVERIRAQGAPVVTVTAPAGYGKTTLLREWAELDDRPFAWVELDEQDDAAATLLAYIACALDRIEPVDGRVFAALSRPGPALWKTVLPPLGASLAARRTPVVLVLDGAHVLASRVTLKVLAALVEHLPSGSSIVLSGRIAPALPLARLRAQGRLAEVGPDDLRLGDREAYNLFRRASVRIGEPDARVLAAQAEGWPAGLHLAALALRRRTLTPEILASFSGSDRFVTDYFRLEILAGLPPATVEFLTRISVLDRLSGPLCDALLQCSGCARALEAVERSGLFLVALDRSRREYRFHRLFRDVLRDELERREPELVPVLHSRAAAWFEAHGQTDLVVDHAVAAGDLEHAASLVSGLVQQLLDRGRIDTAERWLALLHEHGAVERDVPLAVHTAWVHALRGRTDDAVHWAWVAENAATAPGGPGAGHPSLALLRAAMCRTGLAAMLADAETAVAGFPPGSPTRPGALVALAGARLLAGETEAAEAAYAQAADAAVAAGSPVAACVAFAQRSLLAGVRHDLEEAGALAARAAEVVRTAGLEDYGITSIVDAASARAAAAHGDARAAERALAHAQSVRPQLGPALPWLAAQTRLELAQAHLAIADFEGAKALLAEVDTLVRRDGEVGVPEPHVQDLRRQIAAGGDEAHAWASTLTAAELRLLPLLTTYLTFREIAERLFVSRNTAKTQAISVYRKLGVSSRSEAIERAVELGLVEPSAVPAPHLVTLSG